MLIKKNNPRPNFSKRVLTNFVLFTKYIKVHVCSCIAKEVKYFNKGTYLQKKGFKEFNSIVASNTNVQ